MLSGTYHVQDINYKRYEIRLTDEGVVEDTACSIPRYYSGFSRFNFSLWHRSWLNSRGVAFLNCTNSVTSDDRYIYVNGGSCDSGGHIYAILIGPYSELLTLTDIKDGCRFKVATLANWTYDDIGHHRNVSYVDIRKWLNQGFWLSWLTGVTCDDLCGYEYGYEEYYNVCTFDETTQQAQCDYQYPRCTMFDRIPIKCGD